MSESISRVGVQLADRSYDVHIGAGARHALPEVVERIGARRAVVVSARPRETVPNPGVPWRFVAAQDGEANKTLAAVEALCREFTAFDLHRDDVVVSVGGGSTTDCVGLAAGLYHRGVAVVHLPTSLLAQVDASVGGKTAVNLPEGKNLVGTYWQPSAVLCDTDYLETLPRKEWTNGYGEIARCHFIGAGDLRGLPVAEQITASVRRKAEIVSADERDKGLRHLLNYGHTLGHALERATDFTVRHGEGVAVGTVYVGLLAHRLGRIPEERATEHHEVVASYGLPTALPAGLTDLAGADRLVALMRRDKKAAQGLAFVLDGPQGAELVRDVPERDVRAALAEMPR